MSPEEKARLEEERERIAAKAAEIKLKDARNRNDIQKDIRDAGTAILNADGTPFEQTAKYLGIPDLSFGGIVDKANALPEFTPSGLVGMFEPSAENAAAAGMEKFVGAVHSLNPFAKKSDENKAAVAQGVEQQELPPAPERTPEGALPPKGARRGSARMA